MRPVLLPLFAALLFCAASAGMAAEAGDEGRIGRLEAEQIAAKQQGQSDRALELLRELVDATSGQPRQLNLLLSLLTAERDAGNFVRAERVRQRLLEHPGLDDGARLSLFFVDAQYRAMAGDAIKAREFFEAGKKILARLSSDRTAMAVHGARYLFRQNVAEATLLRMEGQGGSADAALKRARQANEEDRRYFREGPGRLHPHAERERLIAESDRANLYMEIISNHLETGYLGAAELVALDWIAATEQPEQRAFRLNALKRYGDVLLASRRFAKALEVFDRLLAEHRQAGRDGLSRPVLLTNRSRAQALMGLQRWEDALAAFENLERLVRGNPAAREILRGGIDRALTRAMAGRALEAEKVIDNTLQNLERSYADNHPLVIAAHGARALILARLGRDALALPLFEAYVKAHGLGAGGDGEQEEAAVSQLRHRLVLEAYLALLARQPQSPETLAQAFRIADALRGGRVQRAIAASAARGGIRDPELARLIREEQNLGAEIANLYRNLNQRGEEEDAAQGRVRLEAAEKRRAEILATLRRSYPEYDRLIRPTPPAPEDIARLLTGEEIFVSIYTTSTQSYVFTVDAGGKTGMHVAPVGTAALTEAVKRLRAALDVGDTPLERLPAFDVATAHQLYLQLLEPLRPAWQGARHLIVSAGGALGELPFSLLVERPGTVADTPIPFAGLADITWLVRDRAISHVPSAAALVALRRLPPPAANRQPFIGFGDPDFGAPTGSSGKFRNLARRGAGEAMTSATLRNAYRSLPPLPDTRAEVLALAQALGARSPDATLLGAAALRGNVLNRDLSRHAVVAFATHGLQPGDLPGLDEPALAMSLPGNEAQSPLLTLSDVLGLKLDADWVVLSACNTASGDGDATEALSGLGRGFFFAGARALLVTRWPVESASARSLVSAIFARHSQAPADLRAEALRAAQLELMRTTAGQQYSYAHPLFWAPFALVGDGGGRKAP